MSALKYTKTKPRFFSFVSLKYLKLLWFLLRFRMGMRITEAMIFRVPYDRETAFFVCPRCHITLEREFVAYCDRCGQRLNWRGYEKARKVYPGHYNSKDTGR